MPGACTQDRPRFGQRPGLKAERFVSLGVWFAWLLLLGGIAIIVSGGE